MASLGLEADFLTFTNSSMRRGRYMHTRSQEMWFKEYLHSAETRWPSHRGRWYCSNSNLDRVRRRQRRALDAENVLFAAVCSLGVINASPEASPRFILKLGDFTSNCIIRTAYSFTNVRGTSLIPWSNDLLKLTLLVNRRIPCFWTRFLRTRNWSRMKSIMQDAHNVVSARLFVLDTFPRRKDNVSL